MNASDCIICGKPVQGQDTGRVQLACKHMYHPPCWQKTARWLPYCPGEGCGPEPTFDRTNDITQQMFDYGESRYLQEQYEERKRVLGQNQYTVRAVRVQTQLNPDESSNSNKGGSNFGFDWMLKKVTADDPSERLKAEMRRMKTLYGESSASKIIYGTVSPAILRDKGITIETLFLVGEKNIIPLLKHGYTLSTFIAIGAQFNHLLDMGFDVHVLKTYRASFPIDLMIRCYGLNFRMVFEDICMSSWEQLGRLHLSISELKSIGARIPVMLRTFSHTNEYYEPFQAKHMPFFGLTYLDWIELGFDLKTAEQLRFTQEHAKEMGWPTDSGADECT